MKKQLYLVTQLLLDLNEKMDSLFRTQQISKNNEDKEDKDFVASLAEYLPVTTEEDLEKLERTLMDQKKYNAMVSFSTFSFFFQKKNIKYVVSKLSTTGHIYQI